MASKPTVTMVLAGDESKLTDAFDKVGAASKKMADKVDDASKDMRRSSSEGFDRVGEGFDELDTKAMGFRDSLTGVQDTASGVSQIMQGDLFNGFLTLGAGLGDLGSAFYNLIIPALSTFWTTLTTSVIPAVWSFTSALLANPIFWVVAAIVALIAIIVLLVTHWEWVKTVVGNVVGWIRDRWNDLMGWFAGIPAWFGRIFSGLGDIIGNAFKSGINFVIGIVNWIIDRINWLLDRVNDVTGIVGIPAIPHIPHIPRMHTGGIVPGAPGSEQLAILQAGEKVSSAASSGGADIVIRSGGTALDDALVELLRAAVQRQGGNVQAVLGT